MNFHLVHVLWLFVACAPVSGPFAPLTTSVQLSRSVPVCLIDGVDVLADLGRPAASNHARRAVLLVHGGGWSTGGRQDFEALMRSLASVGVTAISADYRLSPLVRHPRHLEDVKCALRWVHTHAAELDIDAAKVAIIGASAGAHLAALVAFTPDDPRFEGTGAPSTGGTRVAAAVLHGGPHDLTKYTTFSPEQQGAVNALLGTSAPTDQQLRDASPISWVTANSVPTLILHGALDQVVPPSQATMLADRLTSVGATARIDLIPDAGHSDFGSAPDAIGQELLAFLQEALR